MAADSAPLAPAPETVSVRTPLVVSFDLAEAGSNIAELAEEINGDGGNANDIARRIRAEIEWLFDLLEEMEDAP